MAYSQSCRWGEKKYIADRASLEITGKKEEMQQSILPETPGPWCDGPFQGSFMK